jgi:PAS domain S-box-containing protein
MRDMTLEDLHGHVGVEHTLTYADGVLRRVYVVDREVPFPDGRLIVSRTDPSGVITHANESFVAMSGYSIDELIGQQHYILRHPEMPAVAFAGLWETVARGEKWTGYVKNLRKDGAYYWVFASVVPNVRDGEIVGYTSVRRKPSRAKVAEAAVLYETLR